MVRNDNERQRMTGSGTTDHTTFLNFTMKVYFSEGFLHNLCPCFDIAFAQLGVIPRTRNKFVEIVAVAERYLIPNHVWNKESKKKPFKIFLPVKLADGRMSMKKENYNIYIYIYNIFNLGEMAGKPFSWRSVKYELVVKYLENLAIEKACCYFE